MTHPSFWLLFSSRLVWKTNYRRHTDPYEGDDQRQIRRNEWQNYFKQNCPIFRFAIPPFFRFVIQTFLKSVILGVQEPSRHTPIQNFREYLPPPTISVWELKLGVPASLRETVTGVLNSEVTWYRKEAGHWDSICNQDDYDAHFKTIERPLLEYSIHWQFV